MAKHKRSIIHIIADLIILFFKLIFAIICLPYRIIKFFTKKKKAPITAPPSVYRRKYLLTKHEWSFYKELKPIADKLGLVVLSKIRMADLVEPIAGNGQEYYRAFGKVKAKHVDFALARPDNLYIELLIELDDSSHTPGNERDAFVESVYAAAGYKLLRVWNEIALEDNIKTALGVKIISTETKEEAHNASFITKSREQSASISTKGNIGFPRTREEYERLYGNKKEQNS